MWHQISIINRCHNDYLRKVLFHSFNSTFKKKNRLKGAKRLNNIKLNDRETWNGVHNNRKQRSTILSLSRTVFYIRNCLNLF